MNRISRFDALPRFTEPVLASETERRLHFRRSLQMTLLTLGLGIVVFALFFGLIAACEKL